MMYPKNIHIIRIFLSWLIWFENQVEGPRPSKILKLEPGESSGASTITSSGGNSQFTNDDESTLEHKPIPSLNKTQVIVDYYSRMIEEHSSSESKFLRQRGDCYFEMGNYTAAMSDFQRTKELEPTNKLVQVRLNQTLFKLGRFNEAIEGTFTLNDTNETVELAFEFMSIKKYDEALRCYDWVVKNGTGTAMAIYILRGQCFAAMQKFDQAIRDFQTVLEREPDNELGKYWLNNITHHKDSLDENIGEIVQEGYRFFFNNMFEEAGCCYQSAITLNPHNASYYIMRGNCHSELERFGMALSDYQKALQIEPQNEYGKICLRHALSDLKRQRDEAKEDALDNTKRLLRLANRSFNGKKFEETLRYCTAAIVDNPSAASCYALRGQCYLQMGEAERALPDLQEAVKIDENNRNTQLCLSRAFFSAKRYSEAIEKIIALKDDDELVELGNKLCDLRKFEEALRCYNTAIKNDPGRSMFFRKRGLCYWKMNDHKNAETDFRTSMTVDPTEWLGRANLGELLYQNKRYSEAVDVLKYFKGKFAHESTFRILALAVEKMKKNGNRK